jgi:plastocyanin
MTRSRLFTIAAVSVLLMPACGRKAPTEGAAVPLPEPNGYSVAPTGTIIQVRLVTDDKGNYFEPDAIRAKPGDVLRLVLVSGMHNFSIPADRNPGKRGLPAPTELLSTAGQTLDVPVNLPAGEYTFQCDPHVALGMVGTLTVR